MMGVPPIQIQYNNILYHPHIFCTVLFLFTYLLPPTYFLSWGKQSLFYCEFRHKTLFVFGNKELEYIVAPSLKTLLSKLQEILQRVWLWVAKWLALNYIWLKPASSFELVFNDGTFENQLKFQGTTTILGWVYHQCLIQYNNTLPIVLLLYMK